MEDSWISLVVFMVMFLEILFFWWFFACGGWVKLQKFGDNLAYKPRHRKGDILKKCKREDDDCLFFRSDKVWR